MAGSTVYRMLGEQDSEAAARLLGRNRFFFGSLDPDLTAKRYDLIQKMKGYLYGVCAELDGELIAMLCVYRAGADRSANPHQVFASALLVDKAHRTMLYSFMELYRLMIRHLEQTMPEVREILLEVYNKNLPSLYMQRMFGSVIVDGEMPNPEEIFIRNYAPGIHYSFRPMIERTHQRMETALPSFDKKKVLERTPLTDGRFVVARYLFDALPMDVYCNYYSACVCRIRSKLFYAGLEEGGLLLENYSDKEQRWIITGRDASVDGCLRQDTGKRSPACDTQMVPPGERIHVPIPAGDRFLLELEDTQIALWLNADDDWTQDPFNPEPASEPFDQPLGLKQRTGLITASDAGRVCFQEVWPYLVSPYLFGTVTPDPERNIVIRKPEYAESCAGSGEQSGALNRNTEEILAEETRRGFRMKRYYRISPNTASVHTTVRPEGGDFKDFDPVFALHLQDMNGSVEFTAADGSVTERTFDYVRDLSICHDEVILFEFKPEEYAKKKLKQILLHFEGSTWKVTADRPCRAYLHSNYIFLRPLGQITWPADEADLGTLTITAVPEDTE